MSNPKYRVCSDISTLKNAHVVEIIHNFDGGFSGDTEDVEIKFSNGQVIQIYQDEDKVINVEVD